jgi:hypothetical protein
MPLRQEVIADIVKRGAEAAGFGTRVYSGRGMGGETCLGIDCTNAPSALMHIAAMIVQARLVVQLDDLQEVFDCMTAPGIDSMGRGQILYFTNLPAEDDLGIDGDEGGEDDIEDNR